MFLFILILICLFCEVCMKLLQVLCHCFPLQHWTAVTFVGRACQTTVTAVLCLGLKVKKCIRLNFSFIWYAMFCVPYVYMSLFARKLVLEFLPGLTQIRLYSYCSNFRLRQRRDCTISEKACATMASLSAYAKSRFYHDVALLYMHHVISLAALSALPWELILLGICKKGFWCKNLY